MSSISLNNQIAGKDKPNSCIAFTPNGNPYKKTNVCSKIGGVAGAIGAIAYLGSGGGDEYICNATKWADKLFKNTKLPQCGAMGKIIGIIALSSGVVALGSALGHDLLSFFDRNANKKRAQKADEMAENRLEKAVKEAMNGND